jgi:hypothetical protein
MQLDDASIWFEKINDMNDLSLNLVSICEYFVYLNKTKIVNVSFKKEVHYNSVIAELQCHSEIKTCLLEEEITLA